MGQKVNPHGLRVGVIMNWDSRWFAKDEVFGDTLVSDYKIREYLNSKLGRRAFRDIKNKDGKESRSAGLAKIEIERDGKKIKITLYCAKPGVIIGRGGVEIEKYKSELIKMLGIPVSLNIIEIKSPDLCAQLVAENIASQLEKRTAFRRAMKMAIRNTMRFGAKGIKISCGGRLGGAEIARTEHYHEGTIPLQTIRADIDYGFDEADTTYGKVGIKVWIYKGEILSEVNRTVTEAPARTPGRNDRGAQRGDRRPYDRDNRNGDRNTSTGAGRGGDRTGERRSSYGDRRAPARPEYKGGNRLPVSPKPVAAPSVEQNVAEAPEATPKKGG